MPNITEEFDDQLQSLIPQENRVCNDSRKFVLRPTTNNITAGNLSSTVIFQYTTGSKEYLDIGKALLVLRFTYAEDLEALKLDQLAKCIFSRKTLYINGQYIAGSNNSTEDAIFSQRITNKASVNKGLYEILYNGPVATTTGTDHKGNTSCSDLSDLFINNGIKYIPPGVTIRIEMQTDALAFRKSLQGDGANSDGSYLVNDLYLKMTSVFSDVAIPETITQKFLTINSYKSEVLSASNTTQLQVKSNLVKVGVAFQSTAATSDSKIKLYNSLHFRYVTDYNDSLGDPGITALNSFIIKAGSKTMPVDRLDLTTYNFRDAYMDFINENHSDLNDIETYQNWLDQGPIYAYQVVKSPGEEIQIISVDTSFASTPAAYVFIFALNEVAVRFKYKGGVLIDTIVS